MPFELSNIGQWWGNDAINKCQIQIDIVGTFVDKEEFLIGSCKYGNQKIGVDEWERLKHSAQVFGKGKKYHYFIFSKGGFTRGLEELGNQGAVKLITLADLYKQDHSVSLL